MHNRERFYAIEIQGCVRGIRSIEGRRCLKGQGRTFAKKVQHFLRRRQIPPTPNYVLLFPHEVLASKDDHLKWVFVLFFGRTCPWRIGTVSRFSAMPHSYTAAKQPFANHRSRLHKCNDLTARCKAPKVGITS